MLPVQHLLPRNRPWLGVLALLIVTLGTIRPALAQEEQEPESRGKETREFLEQFEGRSEELLDFRPSRDLLSEEESADPETQPASRSRRQGDSGASRRPGTPVVPESASRPLNAEGAESSMPTFNNMPLLEFLQVVSEYQRDLNFILHPDVDAGSVTIKSANFNFLRDNPQDVIQTILEVNGLAAIPSGRYYKIVPLKDSPQYNVETRKGKTLSEIPDDDRLITQIVPLDHIAALELSTALNDFVTGQGHAIVAHEGTNTLIISSSASSIRRMLKIIEHLDVPSNTSEENLFVYYLENAESEALATILNDLYADESRNNRTSAQNRSAAQNRAAAARNARNRNTNARRRNTSGDESVSSVPSTEEPRFSGATVVPYNDINALIVRTTPRNYKNIKRTIALLDIAPKQVFIEMLIAEITLDDDIQLGVEWAAANTFTTAFGDQDHTYQQGFSRGVAVRDSGSSAFDGFRYMISESNRLRAVIEARAAESKLNVLASPNIVASDNKEAEIAVTDEVPIQQSTITETGVERLSFQYRDAGIKLKITPNINEQGVVSLELDQEVSEISGSTGNGQPTFVTRTAKTTVSVRDGQTLAIGGLIRESETVSHSGVPVLSKIPILGYLFRSTGTRKVKTELVIMITPHVITTLEDGNAITRAFTERLDELKETVDASLEETAERAAARGDVTYNVGDQGAVIEPVVELELAPADTTVQPE